MKRNPTPLLVIGSNSFSGAWFVRHALASGREVIGCSRGPEPHAAFLPYRWETGGEFTFVQADLNHGTERILDLVRDHGVEEVVNFAAQSMVAQSWQWPEHWYQTNVVANVRLHDGLRKIGNLRKYTHISTPEVYGSCEGLVGPEHAFNPSTPYATSRAACDMHLKNFFTQWKFPVVFTRAANVFGAGQQLYRIVPRAVLFSRMGKKLQLHGGGHSVRSFIDMRDVADGTLRVLDQGVPPRVYHFSTTRFISIRDLVALVATRMGSTFEDLVDVVDDRPGKDAAYLLDTSRSRDELGWRDHIPLEAGIDDTIAWVDRWYDELVKLPMDYEHKA